jgi:hypothetical protein
VYGCTAICLYVAVEFPLCLRIPASHNTITPNGVCVGTDSKKRRRRRRGWRRQ